MLDALKAIAGTPTVDGWLEAINELRKGNVKPLFKLPSYEWQTLEECIPEVAELLRRYAPRS